MSGYCSIRAVRLILAPSLSSDVNAGVNQPNPPTNSAADQSNAQIQDQIDEATSRIDTYIGGRYAVPVLASQDGQTPTPVRYWARDIAAYLCYLIWRKGQDVSPEDPASLRFTQAILEMVAVRDGKASLQIPDNSTPGTTSGGGLAPINLGYGGLLTSDSGLDPYGPSWPSTSFDVLDGHWHGR